MLSNRNKFPRLSPGVSHLTCPPCKPFMEASLLFKNTLFPPLYFYKWNSVPFLQRGKRSRTFIFRVSCQFCLVNQASGTSGATNTVQSDPFLQKHTRLLSQRLDSQKCIFRLILREKLLAIFSLETVHWQQILLLP